MSTSSYDQIGSTVSSGAALEARALNKCAVALKTYLDDPKDINGNQAVTQNQRLWLFFYSEIEAGNVTLPPEVASSIISLAGYVAKVSPRAYAGDPVVLETLISINRNIASGLLEGGTAANESTEPPAQNAGFSETA